MTIPYRLLCNDIFFNFEGLGVEYVMSGNIRKTIKIIVFVTINWFVFIVLSSSVTVRGWFAAPLIVHDNKASGDACYVLAGGNSIWERLAAGADLIHLQRVPTLQIMRNDATYPYSFKAQASWTGTQWSMDFLEGRGVPRNRVVILAQPHGFFGTLAEARNVAKLLPRNIKKLVVVSSPAHMRRTVLAFKRSLPADVSVVPYAATTFEQSAEMYYPIWIEYLKLLVYYVVA
jgi:uncharacterized SAM-binding protein YcdF (DUF218 family)